ncbi:MAG: NnrS family protein [Alphaproteobacteria bacterium]|nr:NnrS family protein [Alphaproteobacteria bacterium]
MREFFGVFLSYGFRPFFLFAGVYALAAMGGWVYVLHGLYHEGNPGTFPHGALPPHLWHAHEMIFGYAGAAIAGFFLTAVPNWTGREPVRGALLGGLALAWLAGRAAMWSAATLPPAATALFDLLFAPFLAVLVARALSGGWSKRNVIFLPVFAGLLIANILFHLDAAGILPGQAARGLTLALDCILFLIAVIGGRVVPAFTTNALRRMGEDRLPISRPPVEIAALLSIALLLVADLIQADGWATGAIAAVAAVAHAIRLAGWRGHRTLSDPIVWVLHLGYAWLVAGLALKGLAGLTGLLPASAAVHALTIGAVGTMTLAVMSRAALGHTGRELKAPRPIVLAYVLVSASALARIVGPVFRPGIHEWIGASAILWLAAFGLFTWVFAPILVTPRARVE